MVLFKSSVFPAASEYYFGKPIQSLELPECALMAAVLNSPGIFDPFAKPENAWKRRNLVLDKMVEHSFIRADEAEAAKKTSLPQRNSVNVSETAPYYIDAVQKEMNKLSIPPQGMHIFLGLDLQAQSTAQKTVHDQLAKLEQENKTVKGLKEKGKSLEAVLVSADNLTGLIQAIVGGRGYKLTQFNRAVDGHRQVGSVMKPFVYLAALESMQASGKPYTPVSLLHDSRFTYQYQGQSWSPENYGKKYFADVPMYFALKSSLNCATASLGLEVGLGKIIAAAQAAGVESPLQEVPSLTLGAFELSPKEVLQIYSTLANLGQKRKLRTLRYVTNEFGGVVYESANSQESALPAEPTAQLVSMLKQTIASGTARAAYLQGFTLPAAGKTGTTSDYKDSWFSGFTPYLTTVVWVGYDDNTSHGLTGASGALPIWTTYMKSQAVQYPADDFVWPSSLVKVAVPLLNEDPKEKGPPVELLFVKGSEP